MAVLTATGLRKEFAGDVLFDDVSFKVERRDRVALAGPNGAGKTTLLRLIAGETSRDAGSLALAKGTRIALHDQRPPLERGLSLRDYVLAGAADLVAIEHELRQLERAMAEGVHDPATLSRYAEAQARLEHAGGYAWRDHATAVVRGLGFADRDLDRSLDTFSGGELTRASLARALGGDPDLLLLDEPTNHLDVASLEWLERELTSLDAAIILVAHDRWFLEAVTSATLELAAGRATYFPGPWHVWRREKAERAAHAQKQADRISAGHRAPRPVRRALPLQEAEGEAGAGEAHADRPPREGARRPAERGRTPHPPHTQPRLRLPQAAPSGRTVVEATGVVPPPGTSGFSRTPACGRAGRARRARRPERLGEDDPARDRPRPSRARRRLGTPRPRSRALVLLQQEIELDETVTVLAMTQRATNLNRPEAQRLLGRFLFSGWEMHERLVGALSGGEGGAASPWRSSSRRAGTSWSSTSRPTTSTWRAARRSRPRSRHSLGPCFSSRTTVRSSTQ